MSSLLVFDLIRLLFLVAGLRSGFCAREIGVGADLAADAAVDLNLTSFNGALKESPASYAVVEFFAHWCPACRNYKPHYEKVAKLFNGPDAVHPGLVFMTRVDCALKVNIQLCDRFSVRHYPMLLWGPPSKFAAGGWGSNAETKSGIISIDDGRTADRLLNWINKQLGSSFGLDDEKFENEDYLQVNASDPGQVVLLLTNSVLFGISISRALHDVEEATANAFSIILETKMIISETRASLIRFLQLLVAHHPSKRCRRGSAEVLVNLDDLWPSSLWLDSPQNLNYHEKSVLRSFKICGESVPHGYWIFCRGSKSDTRGFSCGLWVLLHSLSVRVEDGESHLAFTTVCEFINNFFICEECRKHFYEMCSRVSTPLTTTSDFALWLWEAHNEVNGRLMKEEANLGTGDLKYPKTIWPSRELCPSCYQSRKRVSRPVHADWNKTEVFNLLTGYYGKTLVLRSSDLTDTSTEESANEDVITSTNAVAVPLGAALAIALASCAFGALAFFWRSQQKSRKYLHQLNSLKNI